MIHRTCLGFHRLAKALLGPVLMYTFAVLGMLPDWCVAGAAVPHSQVCGTWLGKAHRHEKGGWIYLHIEGGPRERGFQHGYLLAKEIAEGIKAMRGDWEYQTATKWEWLMEKSSAMFKRKIDKENLAELDGIVEGMQAAGISTSQAELIAYNGARKPVGQACSAFIAVGDATADGGVVLGHNTMFSYNIAFANVVIDIAPDQGHRMMMQIFPGWIHSGTDFFVTDAGLVGAETTMGGFDGFDSKGVPEFARMRRATQDANSIEDWCAVMKRGNNGGYANAWLLGDVNKREIARLELGLKHVGFEKKQNGFFVGSNVAEDRRILRFETTRNELDIRLSSVARRLRWHQLMSEYAGKITVETGKSFEGDHYDTYLREEHPGERTLCGHWELERRPIAQSSEVPNDPSGAIDAKVVDAGMAKRMSFAARWGAACGRAFDAQDFLTAQPQFEWMRESLRSRPSQDWVEFTAGETLRP